MILINDFICFHICKIYINNKNHLETMHLGLQPYDKKNNHWNLNISKFGTIVGPEYYKNIQINRSITLELINNIFNILHESYVTNYNKIDEVIIYGNKDKLYKNLLSELELNNAINFEIDQNACKIGMQNPIDENNTEKLYKNYPLFSKLLSDS